MKTYNFTPKTERPAIVIGQKAFFIDNRFATAKKLFKKISENPEDVESIFSIVFSKEDAKEIQGMELSVEDTMKLLTLIVAGIRNIDPEEVETEFFRNGKSTEQKQI